MFARLSLPPLWAIVALGVALRLLLIVALPQSPYSDGAWYVERARELAAGLGYQEGGHPTAFWPAGYPVLLSVTMRAFGPSLVGAMLCNLVAAAATIMLVAWFGRRIGGSRMVGQLAALGYALYPSHVAYSGAAMAEVVSTALVLGATAAMVAARGRAGWLIGAGLLFGAATLMRAQFLYFPAGVAIALWLMPRAANWRRTGMSALFVYLGMAIAIAPLTLRNHAVFGEWILISTNGGVALRTGASDDATGDHLDWNAARWAAEGVPFERRVADQVAADKAIRAHATAWIAANPARWVALMPVKAFALWAKDTDAFWGLQGSYPQAATPIRLVAGANQAFYLAVLLASLPCLWTGLVGLFRRQQSAALLILFLMPSFVTLVAIVFTGQIRYHFPAMPFLIVAAAWTLTQWRSARMTGHARAAS